MTAQYGAIWGIRVFANGLRGGVPRSEELAHLVHPPQRFT
jgi:hypothetical protein